MTQKGEISGHATRVNSKKEEPQVIKGAVILTPELAKAILAVFDEMPRRYSQLIDPIVADFMRSPQADVTLNVKEE